jgi:hypothetical protein
MFRGVIWYSGQASPSNDAAFLRNLQTAQRGIGDYLDHGGRLLIVASNAVGDTAGLSFAFTAQRLGVDGYFRVGRERNINLAPAESLYTGIAGQPDTVRTTWPNADADFLIPAEGTEPVLWVPPGFLSSRHPGRVAPSDAEAEACLGLLRQSGDSRFAVITLLLSRTVPEATRNRITEALLHRLLD